MSQKVVYLGIPVENVLPSHIKVNIITPSSEQWEDSQTESFNLELADADPNEEHIAYYVGNSQTPGDNRCIEVWVERPSQSIPVPVTPYDVEQ